VRLVKRGAEGFFRDCVADAQAALTRSASDNRGAEHDIQEQIRYTTPHYLRRKGRVFWRIAKNLFFVAGLFGTLLGLAFIPKDLSEIHEALRAWEQYMPVDRETALIIFSGICVAYIFWRDFQDSVLPLFAYRTGLWKDERMSVPELVDYAENKLGWTIRSGDDLESLDLVDALGDAAANGKVRVYGRKNPERYTNLRDKYLAPIPVEHWGDHTMDIFDTVLLAENTRTASRPRNDRKSQVYMDIHFNRQDVKRWLAKEGRMWKGSYAEERERERERQAAFASMINQ